MQPPPNKLELRIASRESLWCVAPLYTVSNVIFYGQQFFETNYTTCEIRKSYFSSLQQYGDVRNVMKHDNFRQRIRATVQNDLVHEHGHRISSLLVKLIRLLHSVGSQPMCTSISAADQQQPVLAFGRLVLASLTTCGNQPVWGPGCWAATCRERWIRESQDKAAPQFDVHESVHCCVERC